ncbi:PREDICTED: BEL1-like homeodomain protein 3 isoform X2 [Lupinus angustifolius]|nr:PREDICTED: BEL1-like homeodomain protein 3 isoform X2 [Lupinus angustifolius]
MPMENGMYNTALNIPGQDSAVLEEISQHSNSNPLTQCYSFVDLNNQAHIINGISMLAGEQGEPPISNNILSDVCFLNPACIADSSSLVKSQGKTAMGDYSNHMHNTEFQEHLAAGVPITPISLAAILATRIGLEENLENSTAFAPSIGALGQYTFNNWQATSNPLSATFQDHGYEEVPDRGYDEVHGGSKWNNVNEFPRAKEVDENVCQPYSSIGNMDPNGWTSSSIANLTNHAYNSRNFSNELSLSLETSPTTGHCSEVSCPDVSSSRELSMGSKRYVQFSPLVLGSRYLVGIQDILAQIARYSFENVDQINGSPAGSRASGNKSNSAFSTMRSVLVNDNENSMFEEPLSESPLQRHAAESKKSQLLSLLQLVDDRYSQCLDEIHTVVSAFHAATELDPQIHAHFALQRISILYKELRERISNHIIGMGSDLNKSCSEENNEWCVDTSFIQKQWDLQQLKRKNHQLWRPQRGLPERSVSVLRDWMFQNFLHP